MLLRQEMADGVEVLSVAGAVVDEDAGPLVQAVSEALSHEPRAVVLDLGEVDELSPGARRALGSLPPLPNGWPLASLVVRPPAAAPDLTGWLRAGDRDEALAQVDRRCRPRRRIEVEHSVRGPSQARAAVAACADELGLHEVCDDVVLLVSELVTNAVRYAAPPVLLEIQAGEDDVVVAVCDGTGKPPAAREADDDAEGGRGMLLLDVLADGHGVRTDPPGKAVWARVRRRSGS